MTDKDVRLVHIKQYVLFLRHRCPSGSSSIMPSSSEGWLVMWGLGITTPNGDARLKPIVQTAYEQHHIIIELTQNHSILSVADSAMVRLLTHNKDC